MGLVRLAGLEIVIRVKFAVRVNHGPRPRFFENVRLDQSEDESNGQDCKKPGSECETKCDFVSELTSPNTFIETYKKIKIIIYFLYLFICILIIFHNIPICSLNSICKSHIHTHAWISMIKQI